MKKSLIAICGAALCVSAFAQEAAPEAASAPEAPAAVEAARPHPERARGPRMKPIVLNITDKATAEEVEAYKKEVCEKIDAAFAAYASKPADEDGKKAPTVITTIIRDRQPRPPRMRPNGGGRPDGKGPRFRGPRGGKPAPEAGAPAPETPAPDAPAPEAK